MGYNIIPEYFGRQVPICSYFCQDLEAQLPLGSLAR
jgi:hypothetical protein